MLIFIRRQKARGRNPVTPLIATKPKPRDVDPDSESLACEPPSSPEESNLVAGRNYNRLAGRHRPLSGSSFDNVERSNSGPRSHSSHMSRVPSTSKEKFQSSEDITLPSPYPLIPSGDQYSPPRILPMSLQPPRESANQSFPMVPSAPTSRSKSRLYTVHNMPSNSTSRSSSPYASLPEEPQASLTSSRPPSLPFIARELTPAASQSPMSPYQHQDAGRVFNPADLVLVREEIPPAYVDGWIDEN
jgi:hypothetical protein